MTILGLNIGVLPFVVCALLSVARQQQISDHFAQSAMSALYMDSSSLANNFFDQNSDANVYLAFLGRRYLLAHHVYAHSGSSKDQIRH